MNANILQKAKRDKMVRELNANFTYSNNVLHAMATVPRHLFIDKSFEHVAYDDKPLSIAAGQTISQPSTVAMQTSLLDCKPGDKVLEIGTGCGYQTAILAQMGFSVYSVERHWELYITAQKNLAKAEYYKPILVHGDGFNGLPDFAKYKGILVTCGADDIPLELLMQLEIGGKLVIPICNRMTVVTKLSETDFEKSVLGSCSFVPMLKGVIK